jgi:hypothetical protein
MLQPDQLQMSLLFLENHVNFIEHQIADLIKSFWENMRNLCVHRECAKRLLAYSPNMQRDTKLSIARLIIVQNKKFARSFLFKQDGLDKAKKPSHLTLLSLYLIKHSFRNTILCSYCKQNKV